MRTAAAPPPTWPQPLTYPRAPMLVRVRRARLGQSFGIQGDVATGVQAAGVAVAGAQAVASMGYDVVADIQFLGGLASMIFGGGAPQLTHAQREQLEVQRVSGQANTFIAQIQGARSLAELWRVLVTWQSGYVGGTAPLAVAIELQPSLPGAPLSQEQYAAWVDQNVSAGYLLLPTGQSAAQVAATYYYTTQGGTIGAQGNFPGNPNPTYAVWTPAGFWFYLDREPTALIVGTQAGVTQSKLTPININVRNALLNQMKLLGVQFTPGGGAAQLFGIPTTAPSGPDAATVSQFVAQAYQSLLGRAPSNVELAAAVPALQAQPSTVSEFLSALTGSAEFHALHGLTAAVTPAGAVLASPGAPPTPGAPLSASWWQTLFPPSGAEAATLVPVSTAEPAWWESLTSSPWLLALGGLAVLVVLLAPSGRR